MSPDNQRLTVFVILIMPISVLKLGPTPMLAYTIVACLLMLLVCVSNWHRTVTLLPSILGLV